MVRPPDSPRPCLRAVAAAALAAVLAGCATTGSVRLARDAELRQDYDAAVIEYQKILKGDPDNRDARSGLERSRLRASQDHHTRARRLAATGRLEESLVEYQIAGELNPANGEIVDEARSVRAQLRAKIAVREDGKTRLESLIEESLRAPLPGAELPQGITLPDTLVFRDASARDVFIAIGKFTDLSVAFDPSFRDQPITIDLRKTTLADALDSLTRMTRNFWKVTAPRTVTVVPDTPSKRREYEEEIVRTFYLSNADLKETIDILRIVVDMRRLAALTATNAITIKDTPDRIDAAGRIIAAIDKAKPEVVIDVELLEVDRTRLQEYGLQIASPVSGGSPSGISGQATITPGTTSDPFTLRDLRNLTQSDLLLTNLPGLYYRLLKTDTNTRVLANPQLRTSEGTAAQARFGERVPVPVTVFAPVAAGGVQTQPITSFNYENIGVNIDITPRTHHDDEVSLAVKVEVSSISGTGFGGLPTFGNRQINTVIRLRDGETNMLAGLIRDDERRVMSGVPGLSDLPLIGRLFAHNRRESQQTDIVLTLTPRIVRVLDLTEDDLAPFRVARDSGAPLIDIPMPQPLPQPAGRPPGGGDPADTGVPSIP
ncbi:MAG: secretin N-terminal domain-containing protein, partial [Acidobacteriota bacterium]